MNFIELIESELAFQQRLLRQFDKLKRIKTDGSLEMTVKKTGYKEYYIRSAADGVRRYVRRLQMDKVTRIQARMTGCEGAARVQENIRLLNELREGYRPCDFFSVQSELPEKYRFTDETCQWSEHVVQKPFPQSEKPERRHELRHSTSFGLMVRSKNEAQIAERLYAAGLEFYYEKALTLLDHKNKKIVYHPDFTIVLPDRKIYWEHKGLLSSPDYLESDALRTYIYHKNGIYQPHNLIVTCDGPSGEYPGVEIGLIVDKILATKKIAR